MGPGFTFAKLGAEGKQSSQSSQGGAPEPPESMLSEGTVPVQDCRLSLLACAPTPLGLPPPTVAVSQEEGAGSGRPCGRPHSPTGTAAVSAGWGSSNSPSRAGSGDTHASTSSLEGVAPPSPLLSQPPESSSGWHESFRSQGSQPGGPVSSHGHPWGETAAQSPEPWCQHPRGWPRGRGREWGVARAGSGCSSPTAAHVVHGPSQCGIVV